MAEEEIDSLMVRLGLEQDEQEFDKAQSEFDSLRSTALRLGAVIGTGLGFQGLTTDFASATDELGNFADLLDGLDVTPQFASDLSGAFQLIGEEGSEAFNLIQSIADIIEDTDWGEISDAAFARGFDISGIQGAESAAEVLRELNEQLSQAEDPERARRLGSALGLSDAQIRLLRDFNAGQLMQESADRNPLTDEMVETAREFQRSRSELSQSITGLQRGLGNILTDELGGPLSDMADFLEENRDAIVEFTDNAMPYLKGMAAGIGTLAALQLSRAALGALRNVPGATVLAAGVGVAVTDMAMRNQQGPQDMESLREDREELQRRIDRLESRNEGPGEFPLDSSERRIEGLRRQIDQINQQIETMQQDRSTDVRGFLEMEDISVGDLPELGLNVNPSVNPGDIESEINIPMDGGSGSGAGVSTREGDTYNINVDARGSESPQATEIAVRRSVEKVLQRSAENSIRDFSGPLA